MDVDTTSRSDREVRVHAFNFTGAGSPDFKKNEIKPHLRQQWCITDLDSKFIFQMERVLAVYSRPYDADFPVVCLDERPCQLLSHMVDPIPPAPGKNERYDYHYVREGTACVFMAIEPLTGKRVAMVTERKTKKEYTLFLEQVAATYPNAKKIIVVQDNLNTHSPSSFYASRVPEQAFELMERFEMIYTPKKASWLNMVEIELAALSKQCLDRRIGDIKTLEHEVKTWAEDRTNRAVKITWQFTNEIAREKLERHYRNAQNF